MSAPHFTLMIRDRIHECAPDHSIETITVGALRKAADAMQELYEALDLFVSEYVELVESGDAGFWDAEKESKVVIARAALAKAVSQ